MSIREDAEQLIQEVCEDIVRRDAALADADSCFRYWPVEHLSVSARRNVLDDKAALLDTEVTAELKRLRVLLNDGGTWEG